MIVQENDYIQHVGVLGMKWGHHKRVDSTQVIKARLTVDKTKKGLTSAKRVMLKQTKYGLLLPSQKSTNTLKKAKREYDYSKTDLKGAKILDKLKSKEKTKAQLSMEEKYKAKGMSKDEAAIAAYQNIKTKKILIGVGATALVLGSAYAGYKIHDARVDKIIKSGTLLQNISTDSNPGIRDAFYSSHNKLDSIKYKGLYGSAIADGDGSVQKKIRVISDIKQASRKNAQNTLAELVKKDSEFAALLKKEVDGNNYNSLSKTMGIAKAASAKESLAKGIINKDAYDLFNIGLVDHHPSMQELTDRYFKELSTKGYNALRDVNDVKYSGYKSINPIIAFNTKGIVDVVDIKKLTSTEMNKAGKIAYTSIIGSDLVKQGAATAAAVLATSSASSAIKTKTDSVKVRKYRDENSKSKLTNTEIIRMLERGK